jgi:glycerol kinase
MKDQSTYLLQLDKYRQYSKRQNEEADKYDDMFKPIDAFVIENLSSDVSYIQSDTSRIARNDNWMKERKKDIQLFETLQIMNDMIRLDGVAGKQ